MKVKCLQCGYEFKPERFYYDELGNFAVCPECEGSFDVDFDDYHVNDTVRDVLKRCHGNTYVYIYSKEDSNICKCYCEELKYQMELNNNYILDEEVLRWHITDGDMMIEIE